MDETVNLAVSNLRGFESLSAHMIPKKKLEQLYNRGLSMMEVSNKLGCNYNQVVYWMKKYGIPTRSWSEATYRKRNPKGDPFKIKKPKTIEDIKLFYLGIALYLGEGDKKTKHSTKLANTDPEILNIFLKFLVSLCGVEKEKIGLEINMFDDINKEIAMAYWVKALGLDRSHVKTVIIRKSKGGTYKKKSQYGTLTIYVSNVKLKQIINNWCEEIKNEFAGVV